MKVMVTGAGALLGQGIMRSLRGSSRAYDIVALDPSPLSAGLYWADRSYLVPFASDSGYLDRVRDLVHRERPDALLVGTDVELSVFAAHRAELEAEFGVHVVVSSPEVVEIADDKWRTVEFLEDHGFEFPRSCLPGDEERLVAEIGYPLIVKPRRGARSVGVRRVSDAGELRAALAAGGEPIIQELVGTDEGEYTAGVVHFPEQPLASVVMRRHLRDGNTYRAFTEPSAELHDAVRQMARALRPWGPTNFQFRLREGQPVVFEINGRFSGTTPLRACVGFNEVEMVLDHLIGGVPIEQPEIRDLVILRHWSETLVHPREIEALERGGGSVSTGADS